VKEQKLSYDRLSMMRRFGILAAIGVAFALAPLAAETNTPLTWQDCVRLAAAKNPQLLSALRAQEAGRAQYYGSYNGIFPHLSLTNSYSDSKQSGFGESKSWQAQGRRASTSSI